MAAARKFISVDYEVFGLVQGVFFRKNTMLTAKKLKLVGWVKNTMHDTVTGTVQGPSKDVDVMKEWLSKRGSKNSRIDKCVFSNIRNLDSLEYTSFTIR